MATAASKARQPDLRRYYAHRLPSYDPGQFGMKLSLVRGGAATLDLNDVAETVEWEDAEGSNALQGTVTLRRPDPSDPASLPVGRGQGVRLQVQWAQKWYKLWEMRAEFPQVGLDGTVTLSVVDEMDLARRSQRDRLYRKDKGHPHGWTADQILRHAARVEGIRLGKVARGTLRMARVRMPNSSFHDLAQEVYRREAEHAGRRFVLRFRDKKYEVVPYQRNNVVFVYGDNILDGQVTREGTAKPVTSITGVARVGKGKKARKIRHTEADRAIILRFGYYHRTRSYGHVSSAADLRAKVRRAYAESLRVSRKATFTVPFTPFLRRGDSVMIDLPREGYAGSNAFAFITNVSHSIHPTARQSVIDVDDVDPFFAVQERLEAAARARKRRERANRK